jgi:hypothetical protein
VPARLRVLGEQRLDLRASVGEVTVSVRMRRPAPPSAFCAVERRAGGAHETRPGADLPRFFTVCERSGS